MSELANLKAVVTADIKGLEKGMSDAKKSLAETAIAANKLDSSLKTGAKGTQSAAFALQNLGRVAQDAPFGFIGIQNNLNPLLESFQRLKVETGSTGGALKALGGSLIGVGGLGFALSLVSSAIVIFQSGIMGFNKKTKEAATAADELAKAVKGIFAESAKEAGNVLSLIAVIDNQNESYKRRNDALKELQRIQPEYFNGLKLEGDAVAGLDSAYKNYIANFKNVIAAKVLQAKLDKEIEKLLELQGTTLTGFTGKYKGLVNVQNQAGEAGQKLFEIQQKIKNIAESKITSQEGLIESIFNQLKEVSGSIKVPEVKIPEIKIKPTKATIDNVIIEDALKAYSTLRVTKFEPEVEVLPKLKSKGAGITRINEEIERVKAAAAQRLEGFKELFGGISENIFISFAEGIGNSVSKGNFFSGLLQSVGQGLKQLGVYFIAASKLIASIKKAIVKVPSLGIIGGIGLVALGSLILSQANKKQGFATGTTRSPAGTFLVGERGPERVTLPKGSRVETNGQLNARGGNTGFIAETILRGKDIAIVLKRTNDTLNRNG